RSIVSFHSVDKRLVTLASGFSSARKQRRLALSCPVLRVAKVFTPTSMPTGRPLSGHGDGSAHWQEQQTYHLPVLLRLMVANLGIPSSGRWSMIFTCPMPYNLSRRVLVSRLQPTGTCG